MKGWRRWSRRLINTILPPVCAHCGAAGDLLCGDCHADIRWLEPPHCLRCGRPTRATTLHCAACRERPFPLRQHRAAVLFDGPVPAIIHQLKYRGAFALAEPIAGWMAAAWPRWALPVDIIVPVPLHRERERERGYNQAALIARRFADHLARPAASHALRRVRPTRPQVGLSARDRQANVRAAFEGTKVVAGQTVLLIDDVYTTGATLRAASEALQDAGATAVVGYCAALAVEDRRPHST